MAIFNTINEAVRYGLNGNDEDYSSDAAYSIYQLVGTNTVAYTSEGDTLAAIALSLGYDPHSLPDMINLLVCNLRQIPLVGESVAPDDEPIG